MTGIEIGIGLASCRNPPGGGASYTAENYVLFDGTNDYMDSLATTEITDNGLLTVSAWVKPPANAAVRTLLNGSSNKFLVQLQAGTLKPRILAENAAGTTILDILIDTALTADASNHFAFACDLSDTGKRFAQVNGSSSTITVTTYTNDSIDWSAAEHSVGGSTGGASRYDGGIQEVWYDNAYYDINADPTIFESGGKPVDLGADGSGPGAQPVVYLKNAFGTFQNNLGRTTDSVYRVVGALADEGTSPSD